MIFIFLMGGCTTVNYQSNNTIPVYISGKKDFVKKVTVHGTLDYYLWGMIPDSHTVKIDKELLTNGLKSASQIVVEEYQSMKNFLISILMFGVYMPMNYKISARGIGAAY